MPIYKVLPNFVIMHIEHPFMYVALLTLQDFSDT